MKSLYNKILKNHQIQIGDLMEIRAAYQQQGAFVQEVMKEQACAVLLDDPEALINEAKEEAAHQAELIISEARVEAVRILEEAEEDCRQKAFAAEEEARQAGFDAGISEGRMKYEALLQEAEAIKAGAEKEYAEFVKSIEANAVKMVLDISKKVISEEIKLNKENILILIKQAFEKATYKENVILKVSVEDYDYVIQNKERLMVMLGGTDEFEIRKDSALLSGSCIVETLYGTIDAGVDTKLRKIEEAFGRLMGS